MNILNNLNNEIDNQNKLITNIFNNIKLQDWETLMDIIQNNNIDYNIKDNSGIYLLEYLIIFNKIDIIKLLLDKKINIDITIENNKSILYIVLKFSYIDILKLFIDYNKNSVCKNIFEIVDDNFDIPLFYAIQFNNIESINLIIDNMTSFLFKNKFGENALFLAVKTKNLDIFKIIFTKLSFNMLNIKNNNGENIFHIIIQNKSYDIFKFIFDNFDKTKLLCLLNIPDSVNNLSVFHYIFIYFDLDFLNLFDQLDIIKELNLNSQDNSGNSFLHYFINNIINIQNINTNQNKNILSIIHIIKKYNLNYNLFNIDGDLPGHILSKNIQFFIDNKLDILINHILTNSEVNLQNFEGNSILFLLVKNNCWDNFTNLLVNKKLNIFILDNKNKTLFDYLKNKNFNNFVKLIVNSYIYCLFYINISFFYDLDNSCKKELRDNNKDKCYDIINTKINNNINSFIKNKDIYEVYSYPVIHKYNKIIKNYKNIASSTYTGSTLDIFCGLLYLKNKFNTKINNNSEIIDKNIITSLKLIKKKSQNIISCNNNSKKICEIKGFEILWKNQSIYFPSEIEEIISNNKFKFFIIPISIELIVDNNIFFHANYLLWDIKAKEVERFEPHGFDHPSGFDYNKNLLDYNLSNIINSFNFLYISPDKILPKIGFQTIEINELDNTFYGDPNGFCSLWCIWWADMRLSYPYITKYKLFNVLKRQLINENISFKQLIRNYSNLITSIRHELLGKANTNNNEWMNDLISDKNLNKLNTILLENI